jgi:murein DD-endopeptidase MepM/ murein hydrolase activator NlpD
MAFAPNDDQPFQFPLDDYWIDQKPHHTNFANLGNALVFEGKRHAAEDIAHPAGTPVYAMSDGIIRFSGPMGGYGWLIIIDHPQANLYSLYGHLSPSRWKIESGPVAKGELIAFLGDTHENGSDKKYGEIAPHLHFGVRSGQWINYPGKGEWRWQAGWVVPCPQDLGWLQPSVVILNQTIPAGGFKRVQGNFFEIWGVELILGVIYLSGIGIALFFTFKTKQFLFSLFYGIFAFALGWFLMCRGLRIGILLISLGFVILIISYINLVSKRKSKIKPIVNN